ncbi:hypothetical protein [Luteipulveratus halotolerans]|uniref:Transmembrane protein n=1 Tax=Luteipulveratus halotolerans TaxID=1631356 RepID=A0A0L6CJU3_9MICO|nr:hypothetical protein [Luteipulveratus halotolerans]KNX37890.1 hypothetical protein VV01_13155 [Luteipulveratus halotolerans]
MAHPTPSGAPKAAPSSDLNARQEFVLWSVASVGFLAILLVLSAVFPPDDSSLPGPAWLTAPVLGWVLGLIVAAVIQPHRIKAPSLAIVAAGVILVALCAVVFQGDWVAFGRGVAGFVIGLLSGVLIFRALHAQRAADRV